MGRLVHKIFYTHKFISQLKNDDIVLYTDAFDVLVVQNKDKIIEEFLRFDFPVIFSAEKICHPQPSKKNQYPVSNEPWQYLNSGCFIGIAQYLKDIMSIAIDKYNSGGPASDDQGIYTNVYLENPKKIMLDRKCRIFQSLVSSLGDLTYENGGWINKITKTSPCIMHANGDACNLIPIAKSLDYKYLHVLPIRHPVSNFFKFFRKFKKITPKQL